MKKVFSIFAVLLVLVLLCGISVTPALAAGKAAPDKAIQLTSNPAYDRNPSILRANDGTYWLFWARGRTGGIRDYPIDKPYNPDLDYYDIYYKTANSLPGLEKAGENLIPLSPPDNAQRDISALQTKDGKIWVFTSTGLGPGSQRAIFYYVYDGMWHGPTAIPNPNISDAHVNALEYAGKIWVFFDDGAYILKAISYDEATQNWSDPLVVAAGGTVAKAIVNEGKFYVVWTTADGVNGIYLSTSTDGINWLSTSTSIAAWPGAGATNWDPVLTADKGVFRLFWAPDTGLGGQFIATSISTNPTDPTKWSEPVQVTTASYNGNNWWDFWPQVYDKGEQYLFYTSERNSSGTARTDGNIWMLHLTVPLLR